MKTYVVVWVRETDGDIIVDYMDAEKIRALVKTNIMAEYTIIDGSIIKSAGNTTFDLRSLK